MKKIVAVESFAKFIGAVSCIAVVIGLLKGNLPESNNIIIISECIVLSLTSMILIISMCKDYAEHYIVKKNPVIVGFSIFSTLFITTTLMTGSLII